MIELLCQEIDLDVFRNLIKEGVDVSVKNNYGMTPIHYHQKKEYIQILLEAGVDPNSKDEWANVHFITKKMLSP